MLHTFLFPPFADPTRQAQFEAVQIILEAEPNTPVSLLLGNFAVEEGGEVFDALLVRPHSITVLVFVSGGGELVIPPHSSGTWQLAGQPVLLPTGAPNPFGQFRRLKNSLDGWLVAQLGPGRLAPELITGFALFAKPIIFGAGVEAYLHTQPDADSFQLLSELSQLPRRLRQLEHPEIQLSDDELTYWAQDLAAEHPENSSAEAEPQSEDSAAAGFWELKARQLWRWLGAEDVPPDAPYGSAAAAIANSEEKRQLEQMRQQIRNELAEQRQAMEAREAEREKSIELLQKQLAQAPAVPAESAALQAQLATETREKAALEEAIRSSRAEAAARNQELDARIQQLGQLIEQFQTKPLTPTAGHPVLPAKPSATRPVHKNLVQRPTSQLNWLRVALVVAAAAGIGVGTWGLAQFVKNKEEAPLNTSAVTDDQPNETRILAPSLDALTDTITREIAAVSDSGLVTPAASTPTEPNAQTLQDTVYQEPTVPLEPDEEDSISATD